MMIRVTSADLRKRPSPAACAKRAIREGESVIFTGAARTLRRIRDELATADGLIVFLGDDDRGQVILSVDPVGDSGSILTDRI